MLCIAYDPYEETSCLALELLYGLHFPRLDPFGLGSISPARRKSCLIGIRCVDAIPIISIDISIFGTIKGM